ncbi:MAG TPA: PaaI family thioesterase [Gemmatimonadaceae bacterium]|nr:PaaI family thioesterase [Gemmatimonadaceae bacterium]
MTTPAPRDPDFASRVRESFDRQRFMATLGASLQTVTPGEVTIALPFSDALTQQHGFLHAGAVAAVVDSACGYAALTLMPPGAAVLSVEFKLNLLAPAAGRRFVAVGRVRKAGRTVSVCEGELHAFAGDDDAEGKLVALLQGTMMTVHDRPGLAD